jgi:uncharacterized protein (DUF849 family)
MGAWSPLLIAIAPNGARIGKSDHPGVPLTVSELARCAAECREAGAGMIHLHIRDAEGRHLLDAEGYRAATETVRREAGPDMTIQVTSEAAGRYQAHEQRAVLYATRPPAASIAIRELIPGAAEEIEGAKLMQWCRQERIWLQYILYAPEDVARFRDLAARGIVLDERPSVLYVLGRYSAGQVSKPTDLLPFLAAGDLAWHWMICAFGAAEHACATTAAALGGHARVGFENNRLLKDGTTATRNADLVAQLAESAKMLGRPLAKGFVPEV